MTDHHSKGGKARASTLSAERRSEIAREAAKKRWNRDLPYAPHIGTIHVGDSSLTCAVLEDGTRVLTQSDMMRALGRARQAKGRSFYDADVNLPAFLTAKNLKPFISNDLYVTSSQVEFRLPSGQMAFGYKAEMLPQVCEVYLKARDAGALKSTQLHVAKQADIVMRGLASVGIVALVDEATGYQRHRASDALAQILEKFIAKELQPWVHTFPQVFYEELFRLRGLEFPKYTVKRPQYFGHLTNDIVYKRLAPGVLEELKQSTPKSPSGKLKHQMHRKLTPDMGHPKLREHLSSVVTIMRLSTDYEDFKLKLDRLHPRFDNSLPLDLNDVNF
ncbi:P63C domain-containing protein [Halomonas sp. McH1-25]|uniref:P63C domain-containing protein n=1 Tax=unclassified Halomonas TaxID=2609666 RepID=UPI001EF57CA9|nr:MULTISPECIES: P63C domain-containing protein [unclassified Halomonas]MCG7598888.1 P63C domain-containing protein [Halomonas sp. McH1-25]MCP1340851.1 P63C domain-containing protein [Halomonas sp. FL8]MCP1361266.1 P63C domain-containing protein [Halomonas sp. BBD45]MCP1363754.1 P63C domain-containing protein [Halomonas sp. BBD48]